MDFSPLLKNWRVQLVIAVIALALVAVALKGGLNFGIEFKGGVRIPISIVADKDVAPDVMATTVDTIKQRINKLGLSQAVVRPLGGREIIVEVPLADEGVIKTVETILRQQGKFEAVIDGRQALSGADVLQNSVGGAQGERILPAENPLDYRWEIDFAVSAEASKQFADAALGKADYPVYMFLDRPENAAVVVERGELFNATFASQPQIEMALKDVMRRNGDDLMLVYADNANASAVAQQVADANRSRVILTEGLAARQPGLVSELKAKGYSDDASAVANRIIAVPDADMTPRTYSAQLRGITVSEWRAIGLLSAPTLSAGLANGYASRSYQVTGTLSGATSEEAKSNALNQIKELKSLISGGKLPVSTVVGSAYVVAPSLGEQFLFYSAVGIVMAVAAVMSFIAWRYRRPILVFPIVLVNLCEILLTTVFMGVVGTVDLAAVAGIVGLIGTGVNDQIIITDELLRKGRTSDEVLAARGIKERIGKAFFIIFTVAGVAIAAMLPLLLSGIVEIMGFALSTIVGILVGVGITRPAFGVIVEHISKPKA
ncbi:MAG: hypothetical protein V1787_01385 [Candidatus Micrarchaeota archaeon]